MNTKSPNLIDSMQFMDITQIDELTIELEERLKENPNDLKALLMLGNGYYIRGKITCAIEIFETAIKVNPKLPYAFYYLGISLYRNAQLDNAIDNLNKVVELSPQFLMAHYWLGIAYWHKGLFKKAREEFESLLQENSESHIAHYHAALACMEDQAYSCALTHLDKLASLMQNDSRVFYYMGNCHFRLKQHTQGNRSIQKGTRT